MTGRPPLPKKPCSVEGCDQHAESKQMCKKNYLKWRLTTLTGPCAIEGCTKREFSTGLCRGHYARKQRGVALDDRPLFQFRDNQINVSCRLPADVYEILKQKAAIMNTTAPQLHRKLVMQALGFPE